MTVRTSRGRMVMHSTIHLGRRFESRLARPPAEPADLSALPNLPLVQILLSTNLLSTPPHGALWVYVLRQASTQAQQNKILISGTIGTFRSGKRGAAGCGSRPRYWYPPPPPKKKAISSFRG